MRQVQTLILPRNSIDESILRYVVIAARENDMWVFVRHRDRTTWEMPAGHIEKSESSGQAALRELIEETGAVAPTLKYICDYQVTAEGKTESGRLYNAFIHNRKTILEHEIAEVRLASDLPASLTYPEVQRVLFEHAKALLRS
ncbi:MAG: NUDIX domain-containing protein [Bacteroidales bacterium]